MSSHGQQSLTVIPSSNISRFELNLDCCYTKLSDETQGSIRTILASFGKHVSRVCSVAIVEYTAKPKKSNEVLNLEYPYIDWGCLESVIKVPEPLPWAIATHHFHSFSFFGPRWQPVADSTIRLTGNTGPDQVELETTLRPSSRGGTFSETQVVDLLILTLNQLPHTQPLSVRSISIPLAYRSDDSNTSYSVTSGYEGSGGSITPRQRKSSTKRMKRGLIRKRTHEEDLPSLKEDVSEQRNLRRKDTPATSHSSIYSRGPFEVFTQKRLNCKPSVPARTSPSNLSWDFDLASLSEPGSPSNKRGRNTICPSLLRQYNRLSKVSIPSKSMSQEGHLPFRSAPSAPRVPPPPRPGLGRKRSSFVKTSVANCHGVNKANKSVVDTDSPLDSPKPSTSKGHDVANVAMKGEYGSPRPSGVRGKPRLRQTPTSPTASGVNRCGDSDETQMYEKNFRSRLGSGRTSEDGGRSRQGLTRRDTPKVKDVAAFDRNFLKQFYSDKAVYVEEEEEEEEDTPQEESLTTGQMTTRVQSIGGCVRLDNDDIKASEPCAPVAVSTGAVSLDVKNKAQPSATAPGARPKSSKVLKRKNTPAALPTVAPLKQQNKFTGIKGAFDEFAEEEEEEEEEGGDEYTEEGASACSDERAQGAACQTHGD